MPVEWRRDTINVFAFHIAVPANATTLDTEFQYLSPVDTDEGRIVMTPEMLNLQWNAIMLYPAGYFTRQIMVEPGVRLPGNWQFATALDRVQQWRHHQLQASPAGNTSRLTDIRRPVFQAG